MLKNNNDGALVRVGRQIRRMRQSANMTPAEFARKLCVSTEVVSRIEKGQYDMRLDKLLKIAQIFGKRFKMRFIKSGGRDGKQKDGAAAAKKGPGIRRAV